MIRAFFILYILVGVIFKSYCFGLGINQDSLVNAYKNQLRSLSDSPKKADVLYELANHYETLNQADSAFHSFQLAQKLYNQLDLKDKAMECNLALFSLLNTQNNIDIPPLPYLDEFYEYAKETKDNKKQLVALMRYASYNLNAEGYKKSQSYYAEALEKAYKIKDTISQASIFCNLGLLYSGFINQDSARVYFNKSIKLYKDDHGYEKFIVYINYANSYQKEKQYSKAIEYLKLAEAIPLNKHRLNLHKILYGKFANCYQSLNDFEKAFNYLDMYNEVKDSVNVTNQNIEISKVKEQFDNEKLRADNLESEAKRIQNRNLLYGTLGLLVFVAFIGFLIHKNTRKKQLIAEQEKELETQKLTTVLKEQELITIDAIIEGQEKERQRIANDLHDDLGGLMTNVKWQFNAFREHQTPELFDKTNQLLEEAYQKIRGIAHAKNAGVIAKEGLLKAVQNIAEKISISNKINIEVVDYGLENRLENSLELMLFRIIQELITNIIKHAKAKNVTIHLTNHEASINIMVEDDGIGFNPSHITTQNKGMGISSIDKRVEYLNGTMTIESELNQGTTIIIDIPL